MNHQIKMIVTDLDKTLLRTDKSVSDYTKTILGKCRETGIKVVYATGRGKSMDNVIPYKMFDGRIIANGAVAYANGNVIYKRPIPYLAARPLLMACDRRGMKIASESGDMHYSNFHFPHEWGFLPFKVVDFSRHDMDAEKMFAVTENQKDLVFIKRHISTGCYFSVDREGLAMIMHKDATKSRAVSELARLWGIKQEEIAAFGDELNDTDLLSWAGIGVAMGNALDEVKAIADFTCLENDEDGVAAWIKENIL